MEPCQIINLSRNYVPKVRIQLKSETIAGAHLPGAYCICGLHKFAENGHWLVFEWKRLKSIDFDEAKKWKLPIPDCLRQLRILEKEYGTEYLPCLSVTPVPAKPHLI